MTAEGLGGKLTVSEATVWYDPLSRGQPDTCEGNGFNLVIVLCYIAKGDFVYVIKMTNQLTLVLIKRDVIWMHLTNPGGIAYQWRNSNITEIFLLILLKEMKAALISVAARHWILLTAWMRSYKTVVLANTLIQAFWELEHRTWVEPGLQNNRDQEKINLCHFRFLSLW